MQLRRVICALSDSGVSASAVSRHNGVLVSFGDDENGIVSTVLYRNRSEAASQLAMLASRAYPHSQFAKARDAMYNVLADILVAAGQLTYVRLTRDS